LPDWLNRERYPNADERPSTAAPSFSVRTTMPLTRPTDALAVVDSGGKVVGADGPSPIAICPVFLHGNLVGHLVSFRVADGEQLPRGETCARCAVR
jgi:hypothetical protein